MKIISKIVCIIISVSLPLPLHPQVPKTLIHSIQKEYAAIKGGANSINKWIKNETLSNENKQQIQSFLTRLFILISILSFITFKTFFKKNTKVTFKRRPIIHEFEKEEEEITEQKTPKEIPRPHGTKTKKAKTADIRWKTGKIIEEKGGHPTRY